MLLFTWGTSLRFQCVLARANQKFVLFLPNGNPVGTEKFDYKLKWMERLGAHAAELLAISPRVMNYKIKTLGIDFARGRRPMIIESMASHYQGKVRNAEFWLSQLIGKFGQAQLVGVGEDALKALLEED